MNVLENGVAISRSFIYTYMVDRVSSERDPSNNFRALKTGYNLFASGHVQSIHMCTNMSYCFYKAAVLPSMKKEKPYNVLCAIHLASKEVHCAHCSCPAGESQSCVHLSAMLHALECLFETPYKAILVGTAGQHLGCVTVVLPYCLGMLKFSKAWFIKEHYYESANMSIPTPNVPMQSPTET